ncbi:MAG TPA: DUF1501 domain-containing protein [Planctomycetaceae bacterium]|mgnify:FL=1|uniref:DUF1501 domain-containing protein n=1 Tax=Gimesia maris TaxID=122 RepID=UPI000E7D3409|nr:DUF1501 domain-containing protein [Planctomycetaceae bacterium]|tara:strand:- start:18 stop:1193 length:1176 start_codon:yes stop_codon:yes gene_type:complete
MSSRQNQSEVSRRDFLRVGSLSFVGLSMAERAAMAATQRDRSHKNCIFIMMTGGASQLETFDPKPEAPSEIRGPLKAISTTVPGVFLSEAFPQLAQRTGQFSLVRSLYHDAAPIHETGHQLLMTGRLSRGALNYPCFGSVIARQWGPRGDAPPFVVLPRQVTSLGVNTYRGQQATFLGEEFEPATAVGESTSAEFEIEITGESKAIQQQYGKHRFGQLLLQARQLVERGTRCVVVNLFDDLHQQLTWDCHGTGAGTSGKVYEYRDSLGPAFDKALSTLLDDLSTRGLLDDTLVMATGEFGRTPQVNAHGGRDHWPHVWSALVAGGGTPGGQVIGASDARASAPVERPVHASELTATVYHHLGLNPGSCLARSEQDEIRLVDAVPVGELISG